MERRSFITLLGGLATWPFAVRAQQPAIPIIGFLGSATPDGYAAYVAAFRRGLGEIGYVEGRNAAIEFRWAEGEYDRMPALVTALLQRQATVITVTGSTAAVQAAKAATQTTPIVFAIGADPVKFGLVASINRPGGNVTGVSFFGNALGPKRLELLRNLVPQATTIAMLVNPSPDAEPERRDVEATARAIGQQLIILDASATAISRQPLQRLLNAALVRCSSVQAHS